MNDFQDFKNEELYSNEGDKCPKCGGVMVVSYNSYANGGYAKTWTCTRCGETESE